MFYTPNITTAANAYVNTILLHTNVMSIWIVLQADTISSLKFIDK